MPTLKTPGAYIELQRRQPATRNPLKTAIPAFIGYTEFTEKDGIRLLNTPVKVYSLEDFAEIFGGPPPELKLTLQLDPQKNYGLSGFNKSVDSGENYFLYNSLRLYFDNGGGECLIVSVGDYTTAPDLGNDSTPGLLTGLMGLHKDQEVTLILFPDAVHLSSEKQASLQQKALSEAAHLKDRFCIFDLSEPFGEVMTVSKLMEEDEAAPGPVVDFRNRIGINNLKYGAAYTPWVQHDYPVTVNYRNLSFTDNAEAPLALDLKTLTPNKQWNRLISNLENAMADVDAVSTPIEALLSGSATLEERYTALLLAATEALDGTGTLSASEETALKDLLDFGALLLNLFPGWVDRTPGPYLLGSRTLLNTIEEMMSAGFADQIEALIALYTHPDVVSDITTADFSGFDDTDWLSTSVAAITPDSTSFADIAVEVLESFEGLFNPSDSESTGSSSVLARIQILYDTAVSLELQAQELAYAGHPILSKLIRDLKLRLAYIPPSGAVTGLTAETDRIRGVWKAAANKALESIKGFSVYIDNSTQGKLNVDPTGGKSINAIRTIVGRGIMPYGARTLAGNDAEWRYIPVRRLFIAAETTVRNMMKDLLFEPNEVNTWINARIRIKAYLFDLFSKGAFFGASPEEAYFVNIGLGTTMTATDVLEGRMIVELGLAAARPAEFIVLKFVFNMQESL